MRTIAIIGGGFCGTMTAVHLMKRVTNPLQIIIINTHFPLIKGIAYSTNYNGHLLNVPVESISALPEQSDHFLNWIQLQDDFKSIPLQTLKDTFAPRKVFARYLNTIWKEALTSKHQQVGLQLIEDEVTNVTRDGEVLNLELQNSAPIVADYVVLATGNAIPRNPPLADLSFYNSNLYYKNPWNDVCLQDLRSERDVLIIGNSLTMIDAVISLLENGFSKNIYTVSPHGFAIMPDYPVPPYDMDILEDISQPYRLYDLVNTINKHMKRSKRLGISPIAVVNSLRHKLQDIWIGFSLEDKQRFLKRISPLWNAWRHRTPAAMYQKISNLINSGKLIPLTGRMRSAIDKGGYAEVIIADKKAGTEKFLEVERVINCTGSQIDVRLPGTLLNNMHNNGLITADPLNIALNVDIDTCNVIDARGEKVPNIFTLGNNLKGMIWETTGIPEMRVQAVNVADSLVELLAKEVTT
ncbi:FAD/NAD(P)-binding protein [Mucilaginibacter agri]|uniref:FAD-dependent oxidoreductase n=1 Tax=Mucilaginibacter agri TaxID=2695265 RepID=A0A965ZH20_9SPHI|nr:FAD/NAD(P)-binding protein [Mucilaginibacter agri]NCD70565.1 FAD-dependent oxidoreductase [Mucilaginibacter agri]